MSKESFLKLVGMHHVPDLDKQGGMVCQIWEDGEVTLQKSGPLMHQRSLHCIRPGRDLAVPIASMPLQMYTHGCAFITSVDLAEEIAGELDKPEVLDRA
jgi:hypothetical protein